MKRFAAALALTLMLAACGGGRGLGDRYERLLTPTANPSTIVATELAFARLAQEKGQWSAFAKYAADDALIFAPEGVPAKEWLRGRENPAQAQQWQTHQLWSSCDGSMVVTQGAFQRPDGQTGVYATVWERRSNGDYRWTVDLREPLETPLVAPEMIQTSVAECPDPDLVPLPEPASLARYDKRSRDGTLEWEITMTAAGTRHLFVRQRKGNWWSDSLDQTFTELPGQ